MCNNDAVFLKTFLLARGHAVPVDDIADALSAMGGTKSACADIPTEGPIPCKLTADELVTTDKIRCAICGKEYTSSLRRHLVNAHGLTPTQYRKRCDLSTKPPTVHPRYSAERKRIAVEHNLVARMRAS